MTAHNEMVELADRLARAGMHADMETRITEYVGENRHPIYGGCEIHETWLNDGEGTPRAYIRTIHVFISGDAISSWYTASPLSGPMSTWTISADNSDAADKQHERMIRHAASVIGHAAAHRE